MPFHFDIGVMNWLADNRQPWLTPVMKAASDLGEIHGFILVATLVYVAVDKRLAIRLSLLVALTMCANHIVKTLIGNPRPFIDEGSYLTKWAVPLEKAQELAHEYSTPSGHAMAGAAFYSYLHGCARRRWVRLLCILAIILTGASRPYLGVHYAEDILLGWAAGLAMAILALHYGTPVARWWNGWPFAGRIATTVVASLGLWAVTIALSGWRIDDQPRAFLGYAGIVTGIVIAYPLERKLVDFDATSSSVLCKLLRYLLSVGLALATLGALGKWFHGLADDYSLAGYGLQYIRYVAVSIASILVAPWFFTRFGLAKRKGTSTR